MPRRVLRRGFRTQPVRETTLIVAVILWVIGFAVVIMGANFVPAVWGAWALALSGLILIIGSLVDGL